MQCVGFVRERAVLRRCLQVSLVVFACLLASPERAEAGRVPIPCTGESLVKVLDIPALAEAAVDAKGRKTEKRHDLGYKFSGCLGGEWVVHVGSSSDYIPLSQGQLELMLLAAGLKDPPPVPSFWSSGQSGPVYIWGVAIGLVAVGVYFQNRGQSGSQPSGNEGAAAQEPPREGAPFDDDPRWAAVASRMQAGPAREADAAAAPPPRPARIAPRAPTVSPRGGIGVGGPPAFGRRR